MSIYVYIHLSFKNSLQNIVHIFMIHPFVSVYLMLIKTLAWFKLSLTNVLLIIY